MASEPRTLRLQYGSRRALGADHAAYWVHGGMLVPAPEGEAPPLNSRVALDIRGPDGLAARLPARVGRVAPGQGFLVSFEPEAESERARLDHALTQPSFVVARDLEPTTALRPPEVIFEEPDEPATDPALPIPDLSPVDAAPPTDATPPPAIARSEPSRRRDARRRAPADAVRGALPRAASSRRPAPRPDGTTIRKARPGERYLAVVIRYPTVASYLPDVEALQSTAQLDVEAPEEATERGAPVLLKLTLPGHNVIEAWSVVESLSGSRVNLRLDPDDERYRRACLYPSGHQAKTRKEREDARGDDPSERTVLWIAEEMPEQTEKMPLRRRIKRMGMEDKINLALSGNREERMALAQDSNKSIHHQLLRNAKLTIDEVAFMSRLPGLNPDVLDKIAENPSYTQNPQVTKALVFNPRTPLRTALRLLDRLPRSELNILARRTGMNKRLVMAAKNKLGGNKW